MGSLFLAGGILKADETKPKAPPASMVFETVLTEGVAELSYLIGDKATGKAAVIDPRRDIDIYVELARKHKLTITHTSMRTLCPAVSILPTERVLPRFM